MTNIIYSKTEKKLKWRGKTWQVRSGTGKIKGIPNGTYIIPRHALMVGTEKISGVPFNSKYAAAPYKDGKGFGWFLWIGTGNYGIHPDGGVTGTLGCIGIVDSDTRELFNLLKDTYKKTTTLQVTD